MGHDPTFFAGTVGSNTFTGGAGADRFLFNSSSGSDFIIGFDLAIDAIELSGVDSAELVVSAVAAGVEIAFGANAIMVEGVSDYDLDQGHFLFT